MKNYYDILGIDISSSEQDISKAYGKLMLKLKPEAKKDIYFLKYFDQIKDAYKILSNVDKKREYDRHLKSLISQEKKVDSLNKEVNETELKNKSIALKYNDLWSKYQDLEKLVNRNDYSDEVGVLKQDLKIKITQNKELSQQLRDVKRNYTELAALKGESDDMCKSLKLKLSSTKSKGSNKAIGFWQIGFVISILFSVILLIDAGNQDNKVSFQQNKKFKEQISNLKDQQLNLERDLESERASLAFYQSKNEILKNEISSLKLLKSTNNKTSQKTIKNFTSKNNSSSVSKTISSDNAIKYRGNGEDRNHQNTTSKRKIKEGLYVTTLSKGLSWLAKLRSGPNVNATKIYDIPKDAKLLVIKPANEVYVYVAVDGHRGYVSNKLLDKPLPEKLLRENKVSDQYAKSSRPTTYLYKTRLKDPIGVGVNIRKSENINSKVLVKKKKGDFVYVLKNTGSLFFLVWVDGYTGYVSRKFL
jgi:curved DNA-binding protein CbpA